MSVTAYGTPHRWFAWRPVYTRDRGYRWLRMVWRRNFYLDVPGAPSPWFIYCVEEWDL